MTTIRLRNAREAHRDALERVRLLQAALEEALRAEEWWHIEVDHAREEAAQMAGLVRLHADDTIGLGYDRDGAPIVWAAGEPAPAIDGTDYAGGWHLERYGLDVTWVAPRGRARRFGEV